MSMNLSLLKFALIMIFTIFFPVVVTLANEYYAMLRKSLFWSRFSRYLFTQLRLHLVFMFLIFSKCFTKRDKRNFHWGWFDPLNVFTSKTFFHSLRAWSCGSNAFLLPLLNVGVIELKKFESHDQAPITCDSFFKWLNSLNWWMKLNERFFNIFSLFQIRKKKRKPNKWCLSADTRLLLSFEALTCNYSIIH